MVSSERVCAEDVSETLAIGRKLTISPTIPSRQTARQRALLVNALSIEANL